MVLADNVLFLHTSSGGHVVIQSIFACIFHQALTAAAGIVHVAVGIIAEWCAYGRNVADLIFGGTNCVLRIDATLAYLIEVHSQVACSFAQ